MRCRKISIGLTCLILAMSVIAATKAWAGSEKVLYTFTGGADGGTPYGGVIFDKSGNLYGTASSGAVSGCFDGCGTVFGLMPTSGGGWTYNVLYSFPGGAGGGGPVSGLLFDSSGNLYGTAAADGSGTGCGTYGCGVAFELTPGSNEWNETVLYSFTGATGDNPGSGLILAGQGRLYGNTLQGGSQQNGGVAFELLKDAGGWQEKPLHIFTGNPDGSEPAGALVSDGMGNLYGTTHGGGTHNGGIAFELSVKGGKEKILHDFGCEGSGVCKRGDGRDPFGQLIFDRQGNLYGVTGAGGGYRSGTIFELSSSGGKWKETVLYGFKGGADGEQPASALLFDGSGNLYGTTSFGGDRGCNGGHGCGTVFELMRPAGGGAWKKRVLYVFHGGSEGLAPSGALVMDGKGNLYGSTAFGGQACPEWGSAGCGVVFEVTP